MAVSPKKTTKSRKGKRRSHHALKAVMLSHCDNCGAVKHRHCACSKCGTYRGKQVMNLDGDKA